MIDIHTTLRLAFNLGALFFGLKIYSKINHIGILALVLSSTISAVLGVGLLMNVITRQGQLFYWSVDIIRLLAMMGLYCIWKAVDKISV